MGRRSAVPSPTSTCSDEDYEDHQDRVEFVGEIMEESKTSSGMPIVAKVIAVLAAIAAAVFGAAPSVQRYMQHRTIAAFEASEAASYAQEHASKATSIEYNALPASLLTKTKTNSGTEITFSQSGSPLKGRGYPLLLHLTPNEDLAPIANELGFVLGSTKSPAAEWPSSSPVPADLSSILTVLNAASTVCSSDRHRSLPPCAFDRDRMYVSAETVYGLHVFGVDLPNGHWHEVRIPEGHSMRDTLIWLT